MLLPLFFDRSSYLFFQHCFFRTSELTLLRKFPILQITYNGREYSDSIMKNEYDICCFPKKWPDSSYLYFLKIEFKTETNIFYYDNI